MPYLQALGDFRAKVRDAARTAGAKDVLSLCDNLRDEVLPALGVRLEDKAGKRHNSIKYFFFLFVCLCPCARGLNQFRCDFQ